MNKNPLVLAIDTSCDDTSASVCQGTTILSNIIASQTQLHKQYGGVFPTVAKQAHKENIEPVVAHALKVAKVTPEQVDAIAVTAGPGLAPALEIGIEYAKEFADQFKKPLYAVNHIEGHILSVLAQPKSKKSLDHIEEPKFPVLSLVISGGHSQFVLFDQIGKYQIIGETLDDAAGECLDKIGRMLNLGYPAGPVIEEFAKGGDKNAFEFPLPLTQTKDFNLSFSGLKTFSRNLLAKLTQNQPLSKQQVFDFCASAQYAVFRHICYKLNKILENQQIAEIWLGGGVAANMTLRKMIRQTIRDFQKQQQKNGQSVSTIKFRTPYTRRLTMDNAAMIAIAAGFAINRGEPATDTESLDRRPRWSVSD